jgi:hypothetical protein
MSASHPPIRTSRKVITPARKSRRLPHPSTNRPRGERPESLAGASGWSAFLSCRGNPSLMLLGVACLAWPLATHAAEPGDSQGRPLATLSVQQLIAGVVGNHEQYVKIPALSIQYELLYRHIGGARRFGFSKVDGMTIKKGNKLRTNIKAIIFDNNLKIERVLTHNGEVGMGRMENYPHIYLTGKADPRLYYYRYYDDLMSYPDGSGRAQAELGSIGNPVVDYWIPDALVALEKQYQVLGRQELIDGADCHVLDRGGLDRLWIDAAHGFVVRRRDYYYPGNRALKERTYQRDLEQVGQVWLPRKILREEFGAPDEPASLRNTVCSRKDLAVSEFSTRDVPDDQFLLPIMAGDVVHDQVRFLSYTAFEPGADPFASGTRSAEAVANARVRRVVLLITANILLVLVLVVFFAVRRRRRIRAGI